MKEFGLIGFPLEHSFSKKYFTTKFEKENIQAQYDLYELKQIEEFTSLVSKHSFSGLNVTIPYKEQIIPYLNDLDETAQQIGAVNVIKFIKNNGKQILKGYNSDAIGFTNSIKSHLKPEHKNALILGTGGASKAIKYALEKMGIVCTYVSRTATEGQLTYADLTEDIMQSHLVIVNATPLGTFPNVNTCPEIPYQYITMQHLLFDAVYNPEKTLYLQRAEAQGATIINGLKMLEGQAVEAWRIWESTPADF